MRDSASVDPVLNGAAGSRDQHGIPGDSPPPRAPARRAFGAGFHHSGVTPSAAVTPRLQRAEPAPMTPHPSTGGTCTASSRVPGPAQPLAPPRPAGRPGLGYWIRRYGPQEAFAAVALVVASAFLRGQPDRLLVPLTALAELAGYYLVAFVRRHRTAGGESLANTLDELFDEYGPPELFDLFVRPPLMATFLCLLPSHPTAALLLGSLAADLLFYRWVARRWTQRALRRDRSPNRAARPHASSS